MGSKSKKKDVQKPIIVPPEVITLPSHQEANDSIQAGQSCSIDFKKPDYECLAGMIGIDSGRGPELENVRGVFKKNFARYQEAARQTFIIAGRTAWLTSELDYLSILICALHYRESSLSFAGVLHNGEKILGTGRKTKLVPAGRGPFNTWEEAAKDALYIKKSSFPKVWTLASCLQFAEIFNGTGYRSRIGDKGQIELSPYAFAGTTLHDETGKYVKDGKYSPTAREQQLGVAAIMHYILS